MKYLAIIFTLFCTLSNYGQVTIKGTVTDGTNPLPYATVQITGKNKGTITDSNGQFELSTTASGKISLLASSTGYLSDKKTIRIEKFKNGTTLNFKLTEYTDVLDPVTVTGTKTVKRKTNNPIIVNIINSKTLQNVQACNLSEGLRFQTGLRVETDCQTCNYTQLRMNGLNGRYSQILINGRNVFSPLTGLYGLEQIPTNMIDRIEIVRGGSSALYGSGAVGGTVNVITKIPKKNNYQIETSYQNIKGANDYIVNGNATVVSDDYNSGATFYINSRNREMYDANGDNYSELPELKNMAFGTNLFFLPSENEKLEINFSKINEYRYGGEMVDKAPHLALQSEERTHDIYFGNLDYQINFNDWKSSFITYIAAQTTDRRHYTGIFPDTEEDITEHLTNPPYGTSTSTTYQGGIQLNHTIENFLNGSNILTAGLEHINDDIIDEIEAYNYLIDQNTQNTGMFLQSDWEINKKTTLLAGVRFDKHNFIDYVIASPRFSFLYKPTSLLQLRATWGTGFLAPQAFDTDLHIAFAGGGISRVQLSEDLKEERSNSFNVSLNFDKPTEHYIYGFTIEGFYTHFNDSFYLHHLGEDEFGELFEKRNGDGATVQGITFEARVNIGQVFEFEGGLTLQKSLYDTAIENVDGLAAKKEFMRTPNNYAYATFSYKPNLNFNTSINFVYTGNMDIVHYGGALEQDIDEYKVTPKFAELGLKSGYTFNLNRTKTDLELFVGVKNIFDAYQNDFDSGKNRDSNYIYGPANPRTYFAGIKLSSK
ncbi:TonB-dependent receptor [Flavicella sp.]|uniref:TonB-dependent receptor n=1 Tax=Flavicella sp. TaxID=2957742 RepID=UPI00301B6310